MAIDDIGVRKDTTMVIPSEIALAMEAGSGEREVEWPEAKMAARQQRDGKRSTSDCSGHRIDNQQQQSAIPWRAATKYAAGKKHFTNRRSTAG